MNLDKHSAEAGYWTITSDEPLLDAPEVAIGTQDVWHQSVWDGPAITLTPYSRTCRVLLRGPLAPPAAGAVDVPVGDHRTWTRIPVGASSIVRQAAKVFCS